MTKNLKQKRRARIHRRIRSKVIGTVDRPRLSIYKSSKHIYTQLIDDANGVTIASSSTRDAGIQDSLKGKAPVEKAGVVGKLLGDKALENKIERISFDRSGYAYHGIISAIADGAREAGLKF
ncbi:MAG: 50S ribosomal protein L18 [Balneolales bacterium]